MGECKNADGTTNSPLTYHRANHERGYDDFHDIYLQRWRNKDKPWKVICINHISRIEREVLYNVRSYFDGAYDDPFEYKKVIPRESVTW